MGQFSQLLPPPQSTGPQFRNDEIQWHGQSVCRATRIPPIDPRAWSASGHHIHWHRADRNISGKIRIGLAWRKSQLQAARIPPDFDSVSCHGHSGAGMVRRWAGTELDESSSWNWSGDICAHSSPVPIWELYVQAREKTNGTSSEASAPSLHPQAAWTINSIACIRPDRPWLDVVRKSESAVHSLRVSGVLAAVPVPEPRILLQGW